MRRSGGSRFVLGVITRKQTGARYLINQNNGEACKVTECESWINLSFQFQEPESGPPVLNWDRTPGDKTDGVYQTQRDYAEVKIRDPGNLDRNLARLEEWLCDKGVLLNFSNVLQMW
jgi:hypothetical protein